MSKKDFILLADYIKEHNAWENTFGKKWKFTNMQLDVLATFCNSSNPKFNRVLWLRYIAGKCGPKGGKVK